MSDNIGDRITALKNEFSEILFLKQENSHLFEKCKDKIQKLQEWYNKYIHENHNHLFIFGLDSFHYQGKIIDVEYDDMKRLYHSITNRMYCEYYKLYQIIVKYTEQVVKDKKVTDVVNSNSNFPKYHDLEPYKQYGTETITQIHDVIMLLFSNVKNVLDKKHEELNVHRAKNKIGINIDNFIQAFHFEIMIMEQKLMLFISYMEFFHKMNIKYLKRFTSKMNLFSSQIDHDIRIDSNSKTKERRKTMMEEFKHDNINAGLLNDLADSIASTSSEGDLSDQEANAIILNEQLPEPPTIIKTDLKNEKETLENTQDDDTVGEETDLNIRKRSSIKCNHDGDKICGCPEKENTQENNEDVPEKSASQQLFEGVETDNDTVETPKIVGDLTRCEFSLTSFSDTSAPTMDDENVDMKEKEEKKEEKSEEKSEEIIEENTEEQNEEKQSEEQEGVTYELEEKQP